MKKETSTKTTILKCPFAPCGHVWKSRTKNPVSCPRCRQYFRAGFKPDKMTPKELSTGRLA